MHFYRTVQTIAATAALGVFAYMGTLSPAQAQAQKNWKAREEYGVVLTGPKLEVDRRATDELRESMRRNRKAPKLFDFGERRANASTRAVAMV